MAPNGYSTCLVMTGRLGTPFPMLSYTNLNPALDWPIWFFRDSTPIGLILCRAHGYRPEVSYTRYTINAKKIHRLNQTDFDKHTILVQVQVNFPSLWSNKVSDRFFIPDLVFGFMIVMNFSMYNTIVEAGKPDDDINITIRPDPNGILSFLISELD